MNAEALTTHARMLKAAELEARSHTFDSMTPEEAATFADEVVDFLSNHVDFGSLPLRYVVAFSRTLGLSGKWFETLDGDTAVYIVHGKENVAQALEKLGE